VDSRKVGLTGLVLGQDDQGADAETAADPLRQADLARGVDEVVGVVADVGVEVDGVLRVLAGEPAEARVPPTRVGVIVARGRVPGSSWPDRQRTTEPHRAHTWDPAAFSY